MLQNKTEQYFDSCVESLNESHTVPQIVNAGDNNQFPENGIIERTGLMQIVSNLHVAQSYFYVWTSIPSGSSRAIHF